MPKKKRKIEKITIESDSDDNYDFIRPKKKGRKFAFLSDSDSDDDLCSPKPSTSKGKIIVLKHKICQ